jgi:hypothetical protein
VLALLGLLLDGKVRMERAYGDDDIWIARHGALPPVQPNIE